MHKEYISVSCSNLVEPARKASSRLGTSATISSGCHLSNQHSSSLLAAELVVTE